MGVMGARRLWLMVVALLCGLACLFGAGVATAGAVTQFGSQGSELGQLYEPRGVAVGPTGDLYVADSSNHRVEKFDGSGDPLLAWDWFGGFEQFPTGVAVDDDPLSDSYGDVYVVEPRQKKVEKFDSEGVFLLMFGGHVNETTGGDVCIAGEKCVEGAATENGGDGEFNLFPEASSIIAVGQEGRVYVGDLGRVQVFEPSGVWRETVSLSGLSSTARPSALAVDAAGNIYVKDEGVDGVREFEPDGTEESVQFDAGSTTVTALAVGNASGEVFVGDSAGGFHVLEYDSAGNELASFGSNTVVGSNSGIALSETTKELYASGFYQEESCYEGPCGRISSVWVLPLPPPGPVIATESATAGSRGTAVLEASVNPEGSETTYHFEYVDDAGYGNSGFAGATSTGSVSIGSGLFEDHPVTVDLTGLVAGEVYHYRVVAKDSSGRTTRGSDQVLDETPPAYVEGPWVTNVAATSATFSAQINPLDTNTEYRLEYGTSTAYAHTLSGDVGEGSSSVLVSYHRQELLPDTTYHYRLVVSNAFGIVEGADRTFTTQIAGSELTLLDGRSWELVSPANKAGGLIGLSFSGLRAASDGSGITYLDFGQAMGEHPVASGNPLVGSQILSVRSSSGWRSTDITLPQNALPEEGASEELTAFPASYVLFSPDLSAAVVNPGPFTPLSSGALERTPYLDDVATDSFVPLLTPANTPVGTKITTEGRYGSVHVVDSTPDKSHVLISTSLLLTPEAVGGEEGPNLYEWSGGRLQLVNILPEAEGGPVNYGCLAGGSDCLPGGSISQGHVRAISDDGRWVAWTRNEPYETVGAYKGLYVRDMVAGRTVRVGGAHALYQTMSSDGSRIFFLEKGDLYEFETGTDTQVDLTATHGAGEANAGVREEVSDVSEDGSYVYFVATGVLANGAVSGEDNLYLLHESSGAWSVRYIATLSGEDENSWYGAFADIHPRLDSVSSRVSPDGRYLAFMSERSLTGYDNRDANSGQPDEEVYLYDAVADRLVCASCNPTGARPVGILDGSKLQIEEGPAWSSPDNGKAGNNIHWLAGSIPTWKEEDGVEQSRYLSDSGRLFFDSPDALVPQDTNGLEDVYEYEPAGAGGVSGCTEVSLTFSQRSVGCVDLISSGTSASESVFLDASETGDDVFFITASKLVPEDYDTAYDVYDAHVCSVTVPCVTGPVSPPPCTSGDSCKAAPLPQPEIFGPTPSATFSGVGNVTATSGTVVKRKSLTRAQKLASALRACRKKGRSKRAVCERQVRRRYGVRQVHKAKATSKGNG